MSVATANPEVLALFLAVFHALYHPSVPADIRSPQRVGKNAASARQLYYCTLSKLIKNSFAVERAKWGVEKMTWVLFVDICTNICLPFSLTPISLRALPNIRESLKDPRKEAGDTRATSCT
ncbi:hypothetical protein LEMLEM_LOCUS16031 [Lemmus lemmus]